MRSPVEHGARAAGDARELGRLLEAVAVCRGGLEGDVRIERAEDGLGRRQAADDARLLEQQRRGARCVLGDGGLGRQVAAADVLGERRERDALQIELLGYDHRSSTGSCPGRWTTWPASSGSSVGQSARKCAPRLSVRVSAPAAISLVRRCGAPRSCSSPAASRTRPASCHSASAKVRRDGFERLRDGRSAEPSGKIGLLERGERGPAAEDEAFEQRVRREPVRSVNARAGTLAGRVQPGQLGPAVEVGDDAAHRVVGRRRHRDRLDGGVEPGILERPDHGREAVPVDRAEVEQRRAARSDLTRNHVARSELVGEAVAAVVEQERAGAAQGFAEENARAAQSSRMELDELEVGDAGSRAVGHGDPVSDRARRVGRSFPERGRAARCEQRGPRRDRTAVRDHADTA